MKKLINTLKKWNEAYPEYCGLLQLTFYDDESGYVYNEFGGEPKKEIFYFHNFEKLFSTNPEKYKKGNY